MVLVADVVSVSSDQPIHLRRDLEQSDRDTVEELLKAITALGRRAVHYQSPQELAENAEMHKNDVVLSIYGGASSRNRMALVPAICESFGLKFIGPDVYGRVIAQDKEVTKRLALESGLKTPSWRVIRNLEHLSIFNRFTFPCVLKPLLEGSSIGISQANLVDNVDEAKRLAQNLLVDLRQPVLVEEFVAGRETALVAIENGAEVHWAYSEMIVAGSPEFFKYRLFDAAEKMNPTHGQTVKNIDGEL